MITPRSMTVAAIAESLCRVRDFVEPLLDEALDRMAAPGEGGHALSGSSLSAARPSGSSPPGSRLVDSMRYALLAPGKRLRPALVVWAAEAAGGTWQEAGPAAAAVEMIHAYSLVHDDLPAMDDDDLRRGRPTCHKAFDEATAILCGDALQALAFETLAEGLPDTIAARACLVLARAAGAANLVGGQADDLAAERETVEGGPPPSSDAAGRLARLEAIHRRKTGALFLASLELGGLAAGADGGTLDRLAAYGRAFGLAFQIADDLLDAEGSEQAAGKRVGKDAARGKLAFPGLVGAAESRRRAMALVEEAAAAVAPLDRSSELSALARWIVERDH